MLNKDSFVLRLFGVTFNVIAFFKMFVKQNAQKSAVFLDFKAFFILTFFIHFHETATPKMLRNNSFFSSICAIVIFNFSMFFTDIHALLER